MSKTIDQRVVEMKFDNKQFESNVSTTMSTLSKLKQSLNLNGAAKGLDEINNASKRCDMNVLGSAVETIQAKFSALQVVGVTALANITNSAVNAGKRIVSALTIDPIKTGFEEYETQINAVQTILANTQSKGTTLDQVNDALDTLNTYADKTIYNFTEMTRNIGTFTAAGIDLDTSVNAIQGIANLAATSGSTSQQASTAMYQLSQALAAGTVKLMDWNSVVNAGMGGQVFQDALKETARAHGIAVDEMIEKNGSFRESLQEGWITSDILTETLQHFTEFTDDYNEETLKAQGYTDEQIEKIKQMGITGTEAATKVKTLTQLWDTLKEAAQSGWTQSWEIIIGDFEEAKKLYTSISDTISEIINKSAEARNNMLQNWKDMGGRDDLIDALKNSFDNFMLVAKAVSGALKDIFPPLTAEKLKSFTEGIKNATITIHEFLDDWGGAEKIQTILTGLLSPLKLVVEGIELAGKAVGFLFDKIFAGKNSLGNGILDILVSVANGISSVVDGLLKLNIGDGLFSAFTTVFGGLLDMVKSAIEKVSGFGDIFSAVGNVISNVLGKIWDGIKTVFGFIKDNVSIGDVFAGILGAGALVSVKKLVGVLDTIKDVFSGGLRGILFGKGNDGGEDPGSIKDKFRDILDGVNESLQSFTNGIKVSSLVAIAVAIGILSASLKTISSLNVPDVVKGLSAMGIMFAFLTKSFQSISKTLDTLKPAGIVKTGVALMLVAEAIKILSSAMVKMSGLSWNEIVKGLVGVGGALLELSMALKIINKVKIPLSTSIAILALAEACNILANAFKKFGEMSWKEIAHGLVGMGGALAEFSGVLSIMGKVGGIKSLAGSVSLLIAVQALDEISENLKKFGEMSWEEIAHGLVGMGAALAEVATAVGVLGKLAGFSGVLGGGAILIAVQALDEISDNLKKIGSMSWEEIGRGLHGMGYALVEVAVAVGALGKIAGFSGILGGGAILIAVQALDEISDNLKKIGEMSWEEIGRGLYGMGYALAEVAIVTGALGYLAGLPALLGGGAILLAVQGLGDLADALKKFGEMQWDEIQRGLTAMGAALGEIALGSLANILSGFGAGAITEVSQSLGVLADSVKKWAGVSLPENLGAQLAVLASGINTFTLSGMGAGALTAAAPGVGVMADSVKKWSGITIPEALGGQLATLATGIMTFTFSGVGAGALAQAAPGVGIMADSVKKWSGVTVPENLNIQLKSLADGIQLFSWAFMGGWSISAVVEPLGDLAGAVKKWNGITVPENLKTQLTNLADGVKAFSWAFMGGWSLSAINGPLGSLADSVKKWNGISIPDNLGTQLSSLASGVKSFNGVGDLSGVASSFGNLANAVSKLSTVNFAVITSGLTEFVKSAIGLASASSTFSTLGTNIVNGIVKPLQNGKGQVSAAAKALVTVAANNIKSATPMFKTAGTAMTKNLAQGIQSGGISVKSAAKAVVSSSKSAVSSEISGFWNLGYSVAEGFANGISAGSYLGAAKARAMALAAAQAAKEELNINSPSKVFRAIGTSVPEGFAQGISKMGNLISASSKMMASNAIDGTKTAIARLSDIVSSDINTEPTIRPVVDLSNIRDGASEIGSLFGSNPALNLGGISYAMNNRRNYNPNDDVIYAIDKLRREVGNLEHPSYSINGITYGSDSEIANAMETIIRAAVVERRA